MTAVEAPVTATAPESPFPGLTHYTSEYAEFFFGRDAERMRIVGNLQAARLTLLYAQSGVGKSSLLSAGVAPRLRELAALNLEDEGKAGYVPVVMREWLGDPTERLIAAVGEAFEPFVHDAVLDLPTTDLEAAIEAATLATDSTLLVILDQFEEYFNYHANGSAGASFADQLAACINRPDLRANFLISIREDAYSRIGDLLKSRVPSVYSNYLHLEYLDRDALQDSITKSIAEFDRLYAAVEPIEADPELVGTVLDQVSEGTKTQETRAGESPQIDAAFVQLVMKRLWKEEAAEGSRRLRLETLERLGGAAEIIRTHLDEAMATLSDDDQDTAATAFRYLVTPDLAKIALGTKALSDWTGIPEERFEAVLSALAAQDLKILRPVLDARSEGRRYEIFHDGLAEPILSWRTRHDEAELREAQQQAADAAHREARERRLRWLAIGALGLVLALVVGGFVVYEQRKTNQARAKARSIYIAERMRGAAGEAGFGPGAAGLVSLEAYRVSPTVEARSEVLGFLQANPGRPRFAVGNTRRIRAVTFVPRSSMIVSAGNDGTVQVWDTSKSRLVPRALETDPSVSFTSLSASADGRLLAAGRDDGGVDLYDITDLARPGLLQRWRTRANSVNAVAFSPSSALLAAGGDDGHVRIWNATNPGKRAPLYDVVVGNGAVNALAFCPSSAGPSCAGILMIASENGTWFWDPERPTAKPRRWDAAASLSAAWAPDGSFAVGVEDTSNPRIVVHRPGKPGQFIATADLVRSLTFADGDKVLVSGGDDWNVTTWDVATGRAFGPPRTQSASEVTSVAVSHDGATLAGAGANGVYLWPLHASDALATTVGGVGYGSRIPKIWDLAVGSGGQVATATPYGTYLWKLGSPRVGGVPAPPLQLSHVSSTAVGFRGSLLAVGQGEDVVLWRATASCDQGGRVAGSCELGVAAGSSGDDIYSLAFDPSRPLIATGSFGGRVTLWNVADPRQPQRQKVILQEPDEIHSVAFSPAQDLLAAAGRDGTIRLWDVKNPRDPTKVAIVRGAHGGLPVDSLAFSPNGRLLASGGDDDQVILWQVDAKSGLKKISLSSQTNAILALAFSHDGQTLAAGDGDGSACLYDVHTFRSLGTDDCLLGHGSENGTPTGIWALRFAPKDAWLLSAGVGNPVVAWSSILWSKNGDALARAVCKFRVPPLTVSQWSSAFYDTSLAHRSSKPTCR
ncbi:MAG: nSTAND1 domain-containing NTPase [Gaiellaceae bacterium]